MHTAGDVAAQYSVLSARRSPSLEFNRAAVVIRAEVGIYSNCYALQTKFQAIELQNVTCHKVIAMEFAIEIKRMRPTRPRSANNRILATWLLIWKAVNIVMNYTKKTGLLDFVLIWLFFCNLRS